MSGMKLTDHKQIKLPMACGKIKICPGHPKQNIRNITRNLHCFLKHLFQNLTVSTQNLFQKALLTSKIVIQGRLCNTCLIHDFLYTHRIITPTAEQLQCTVNNCLSVVHPYQLPFRIFSVKPYKTLLCKAIIPIGI